MTLKAFVKSGEFLTSTTRTVSNCQHLSATSLTLDDMVRFFRDATKIQSLSRINCMACRAWNVLGWSSTMLEKSRIIWRSGTKGINLCKKGGINTCLFTSPFTYLVLPVNLRCSPRGRQAELYRLFACQQWPFHSACGAAWWTRQ